MTNPTPPASPGPFTRRRVWVGLLVAVLALAATAAVITAKARKPEPDKTPPPLQFKRTEVTRPQLAPMPQRIDFSGPLVAPRTAVVKAKAAGTLLTLDTAEGRRVKAGQPLGRMDLADLNSRVDERAAGVESAQAMLVEAQRLHDSNLRLSEQSFISPNALQSSQARLDAARAQLRSSQAQLAGTRIGVREAALVAPIGGIVGKRHALPGEKLSAEQAVLTIVDLGTLELMGSVATHEVSLLGVGQPVRVIVEGRAEPVVGRIDRIAPAAEAGTRAIGVVVTLANGDERLRAGQYAQASVQIDDPVPRLTVPVVALGQASGQQQVWTIEQGALVRRIVITGRRDVAAGRVEVLKGLSADVDVLAMPFDNLKEGAQARIDAASPAAAASTAGKS